MIAEKLFHPSGLNDRFGGEKGLAFADYIQKTRNMMAQARVDITPSNAAKILTANAPFELRPQNGSSKQGLLLVHGLYDSPFMLRDLGDYFLSQGFLVRSILLPGHGTVPGDLLNVHYSEWLKAVDYGVETLAGEVEQIFIAGFSLGGVLALNKALRDSRVHSIVLMAPALALRNQWMISLLLRWHHWVSRVLPSKKWYEKSSTQDDYVKYESLCYNSAEQMYQLICKTQQLAQKNKLAIPIFCALSAEDEVISSQACLEFFISHHHPNSRLLWYARTMQTMEDPRIIVKNSVFPEQKILDFSHVCLPIAPDNFHYGRQGDYQSFSKDLNSQELLSQTFFSGAVSCANLGKHTIKRLSYNPDFLEMAEMMGTFLRSI